MGDRIKYSSDFLKKVKRRFGEINEECVDIFWMCLEDMCPENCCSKDFSNGNAKGLFGMVERDRVPLLVEEKNRIARVKGCKSIIINPEDNLYYLNLEKQNDCPFLEKGKCEIEAIKPSLCRAFPMTILNTSIGRTFDYGYCPGFEVAKLINQQMTKIKYLVMVESFLDLQTYRLKRERLRLDKMRLD